MLWSSLLSFQSLLAILPTLIQHSEGLRRTRALFNTGKFLMPLQKPNKPQIGFLKYPAHTQQTLLRSLPIFNTPPVYLPPRRRPIANMVFKREEVPLDTPPIQPPPQQHLTESQIGGEMEDSWAAANARRPSRLDPRERTMESSWVNGADERSGDSAGGSGHKECTRIPDRAADMLCKYVNEETEDRAEFLWVPLTTPLTGYPLNTRLERWFQKGCFNWKLKKCGGSPRFPLSSNCRFWSPEAVSKPGCPQVSKEREVNWKDYPPNKCPCKWPCTPLFASIQECYEMRNGTVDTAEESRSGQRKQGSLRLSSAQALQLCRAVEKSGSEAYATLGWVPIPLSIHPQQNQPQCNAYVFTPCQGGQKDKEDCGKWRREQSRCEASGGLAGGGRSGSGRSMGTSACPCLLPCIRFFDSINKCELGGAGGEEERSAQASDGVSMLLRDKPRSGTAASLIECNWYDQDVFCTVIPSQSESVDTRSGSRSSSRRGRVKCLHVDSKPVCNFVMD